MQPEEYLTSTVDYAGSVQSARTRNMRMLFTKLFAVEFDDDGFPPAIVPKIPVDRLPYDFDLREKIEKTASDFGWENNYVANEILFNPLFAASRFTKDPQRQSKHQSVAIQYIKKHTLLVKSFIPLDSGGLNAKYVINGMVPSTAELGVQHNGKSLDFEWSIPNTPIRVFASHKYTGAPGGTQDNQFSDLRQFVQAAAPNRDRNRVFIAIADGAYYTEEKMLELQNCRLGGSVNIIVCNVEQVWKELVKVVVQDGRRFAFTADQQELIRLLS